jgi:hypothetical protein
MLFFIIVIKVWKELLFTGLASVYSERIIVFAGSIGTNDARRFGAV